MDTAVPSTVTPPAEPETEALESEKVTRVLLSGREAVTAAVDTATTPDAVSSAEVSSAQVETPRAEGR